MKTLEDAWKESSEWDIRKQRVLEGNYDRTGRMADIIIPVHGKIYPLITGNMKFPGIYIGVGEEDELLVHKFLATYLVKPSMKSMPSRLYLNVYGAPICILEYEGALGDDEPCSCSGVRVKFIEEVTKQAEKELAMQILKRADLFPELEKPEPPKTESKKPGPERKKAHGIEVHRMIWPWS